MSEKRARSHESISLLKTSKRNGQKPTINNQHGPQDTAQLPTFPSFKSSGKPSTMVTTGVPMKLPPKSLSKCHHKFSSLKLIFITNACSPKKNQNIIKYIEF